MSFNIPVNRQRDAKPPMMGMLMQLTKKLSFLSKISGKQAWNVKYVGNLCSWLCILIGILSSFLFHLCGRPVYSFFSQLLIHCNTEPSCFVLIDRFLFEKSVINLKET